jgi:hypothetical protein
MLDFYLSLFLVLTYKINTLAQVGAHVSHQERAVLPSPAFLFYICMSVCVLFLIPPSLLVRFMQHTHNRPGQVVPNMGPDYKRAHWTSWGNALQGRVHKENEVRGEQNSEYSQE